MLYFHRDNGSASNLCRPCSMRLSDRGPEPFVFNIEQAAEQNRTFRTALWTGRCLQLTLMSIPEGGDIGAEIHRDTDQVFLIKAGQGIVRIGSCREKMNSQRRVGEGDAVFVPAGTWHNLINTGNCPLKLCSVYAPPNHPRGTVHCRKKDAERAEK